MPAGTPAACGLPGRPGSRRILGPAGPGCSESSLARRPRADPRARGWPHLLGREGGVSKGASSPSESIRTEVNGRETHLSRPNQPPSPRLHPAVLALYHTFSVSHLNFQSCLHMEKSRVPETTVSNMRIKVGSIKSQCQQLIDS